MLKYLNVLLPKQWSGKGFGFCENARCFNFQSYPRIFFTGIRQSLCGNGFCSCTLLNSNKAKVISIDFTEIIWPFIEKFIPKL